MGLRRDSLHWACLPCPSHPCLALPCQALPPGPVPGAGSALVAAFSPLSLLLPELQMGAAWWEAQPGCSRLWPGLLPPPFPRGSLPSPPLPCPALPSPRWRAHARLREASGGNGRRERRGGVEGNGRRRGALRVELPAGRSGAALRRRAFSGRTARGAETLPRGIGEGRKPLSSGKQVAGSLPRGPEPVPGPAVRSRCCSRHRVCSRLWNMGVTLRV